MSVLTMTLHQAQLRSRLPTARLSEYPTTSGYSPPLRGTKRSRDAAIPESITRTQKRVMDISQREREMAHEMTVLRLFDAQKQADGERIVTSPVPACVDCGCMANQGPSLALCQGCANMVCKNCSICVYNDTGDYEACFTCSQQ